MSTQPRPQPVPDPDAEQEVDLGAYAARLAARWWLVLLGVVAGVLVGALVSFGGTQVYRAAALVDLGQPLSPSGAPLPSIAPTVGDVREIVTSEAAIRRAARESGMAARSIRRGISLQQVGQGARGANPSLVNVRVQGQAPGRAAAAANELAKVAVEGVGRGYVQQKVRTLSAQVASASQEIESLDRRIDALLETANAPSTPPGEAQNALVAAGILEQRRAIAQQTKLDREQLLSLARTVEQPRVVEPAVARRVTAQSRRNAIVVGAALGLIAGLIAALAWDPVAERLPRRPVA